MVELTKASTKGQVVIPQRMREKLGIKAGDPIQIERVGDLIVLKRVGLRSLKKELEGRR